MRKLLLLLALSIFCFGFTQTPHEKVVVKKSVSDWCASCTGEADADVFCEDFEGSETITNDGECAECTNWSATETGDGAATCASHSGTLSCTDKGSYALNSSASNDSAFIIRQWTDTNDVHIKFYFNFVTDAIVTGGSDKRLQFFELEGDNVDLAKLQIQKIDGDQSLDLRLGYYVSASMAYETYDANLSTGTWYKIELSHDRTADTVVVWLDDVQTHSKTVDDMDTDEAEFGISADGDADNVNVIQIDNIKADDDTMPGDCS